MTVKEILPEIELLIDTQQTIVGRLINHIHQPYLGESTSDLLNGRAILLCVHRLFNDLLVLIFPHVLGGGTTLFYHTVKILGRIDRDANRPVIASSIFDRLECRLRIGISD